jgi:acyl carrier protein
MSQASMDRIAAIFTAVVGAPPVRGAETLPHDVPEWDSLAHIKFVHAVESEFGCELPEEFLLVGKPLGEFAAAATRRQS